MIDSRRKLAWLVPIVGAAAVTLAACTGATTATTPTQSAAPTGTPASAAPASSPGTATGAPASLKYLIPQPEAAEDLDKIKADLAAFTAATNIDVNLEVLPFDQLRTVLQTQLRSGSGPDVFQSDTGPGFAGVLADAGLLYDLTSAYTDNGWSIFDWAKQRVTFDGKALGVPDAVESVGVYYNKKIFEDNGIAVPQTLEELDAAAAKLKAAGVIPMSFADKDGWPAGHILSMSLASRIGAEAVNSLIAGDTPWSDPAVVDSISTFFDKFNASGYLPKSPAAIDYDAGNALFYSGKAAMLPTGTWLVSDITNSAKFDVGYFPFPGPAGTTPTLAGGLGSGTFVSASTKAPDAAIQLLNYMQTPEHGKWQISELNTIPAFPVDTASIEGSPLLKQVLDQTSQISSGAGEFGPNIDVLMTDQFNEAMWSGLQSVLTGDMTAQEVADSMQEAAAKSATN